MNELFIQAAPVIKKIEDAGYEAYFVGGAVRDWLLGRDINDVDIASSATPSELKEIFHKTVDVGIEHGTILVLYSGTAFEVTTFRTESDYADYRRPDRVTFIRSLEEDLRRRDFTMNAIAMDRNGHLIDPFGGCKAIKEKRIETVGSPDERFQEDALRLLRAIRFAGQLGFQIQKDTVEAMRMHASLLSHIAAERITAETTKLFAGMHKKKAFRLMVATGLNQYLPSMLNENETLKKCLDLDIDDLDEMQTWLLMIALSNPSKPLESLRKWKLPSRKMKSILNQLSWLRHRSHENWSKFTLYQAGKEAAATVEMVYHTLSGNQADSSVKAILKEYESLPITSRKELAVTGNDLAEWCGKPGGPWMKDLLGQIEQAVINEDAANDREDIRKWLAWNRHP
ncbi:MAG TPA: CCA tRNA nucleotidyltransferase [Bacillaceae bacterium]